MDIRRELQGDTTHISISGECNIYHASSAKEELLISQEGIDGAVELNLQGVVELDIAGVQLLMMLDKLVSEAGGSLIVGASNAHVDQVMSRLGLYRLFFGEGAENES